MDFTTRQKSQGPGVVTGRSGLLGKVFLVQEAFWPLNTVLFVKEFRKASPYYTYHLLKTIDLSLFNAGSAVPSLNRNHVHNLPVLEPLGQLITVFENLMRPMFQKIYQNEKQTIMLSKIRDALLPKLISGEIRVPEVEAVLGRAV